MTFDIAVAQGTTYVARLPSTYHAVHENASIDPTSKPTCTSISMCMCSCNIPALFLGAALSIPFHYEVKEASQCPKSSSRSQLSTHIYGRLAVGRTWSRASDRSLLCARCCNPLRYHAVRISKLAAFQFHPLLPEPNMIPALRNPRSTTSLLLVSVKRIHAAMQHSCAVLLRQLTFQDSHSL